MSCATVKYGRRCLQETETDLCPFHELHQELKELGEEVYVDRYYEEKVMDGILSPATVELRLAELRAMFFGRRHRDGRRLDDYVLEEESTEDR
jgi:hypothetical protein